LLGRYFPRGVPLPRLAIPTSILGVLKKEKIT